MRFLDLFIYVHMNKGVRFVSTGGEGRPPDSGFERLELRMDQREGRSHSGPPAPRGRGLERRPGPPCILLVPGLLPAVCGGRVRACFLQVVSEVFFYSHSRKEILTLYLAGPYDKPFFSILFFFLYVIQWFIRHGFFQCCLKTSSYGRGFMLLHTCMKNTTYSTYLILAL